MQPLFCAEFLEGIESISMFGKYFAFTSMEYS
jgi:hypothetical protein